MAGKTKRWIYLLVGVILLLLLGLIYAWSIFIKPLEAEFGWDRAQTTMTFTFSIIFFCLGGMAGGLLTGKTSPRIVLILSAAFLLAGFLGCSQVHSLSGIYVAYGIFVGFGVGLSYNVIINTITKWFPDKKGLSSGALLMGFGIGGMVLGTITDMALESIGWRQTFVLFAVLFSVIVFISSFIIKMPSDAYIQLMTKSEGNKQSAENQKDYSTLQMIKRPTFWFYFIWNLALTSSGLIIIGHAKAVAEDIGALASAAFIAGLVSVFNGLGRILFGMLYDKIKLKKSMLLITICAFIAVALLLASYSMQNIVLLSIGFIFTGAFYGAVPTMNSTFTSSYFGLKHFATNFSVTNASLLAAPVIGSYLAGALRTNTNSYFMSFIVMLILACIALVFGVLLRKRKE